MKKIYEEMHVRIFGRWNKTSELLSISHSQHWLGEKIAYTIFPTTNRFRLPPEPPMNLRDAFPHTKKWWPSWNMYEESIWAASTLELLGCLFSSHWCFLVCLVFSSVFPKPNTMIPLVKRAFFLMMNPDIINWGVYGTAELLYFCCGFDCCYWLSPEKVQKNLRYSLVYTLVCLTFLCV